MHLCALSFTQHDCKRVEFAQMSYLYQTMQTHLYTFAIHNLHSDQTDGDHSRLI